MNFEFVRGCSTEDIRSAVRDFKILLVNSSATKWSMPGLSKDIADYGSAKNILEDLVPYYIEDERQKSAKQYYEAKLTEFEAKYPELATSDCRIGILNSRPNSAIHGFSPADQTITVGGGISISKLNRFLSESGQCLPLYEWLPSKWRESNLISPINTSGSIDKLINLNLPHILENQCGSWRDWVLGMKVVLSSGEIVSIGSKVVKNVAGFDLHKLIIGSYGSLAVIAEVTIRTFPVQNLPKPKVQEFDRFENTTGQRREMYTWIQRVQLSDIEKAISATKPYVREVDLNTGTLWGLAPIEVDVPKLPGSWMRRNRSGEKNIQLDNKTQIALMKRTKEIFDPANKLNPGVFGFI